MKLSQSCSGNVLYAGSFSMDKLKTILGHDYENVAKGIIINIKESETELANVVFGLSKYILKLKNDIIKLDNDILDNEHRLNYLSPSNNFKNLIDSIVSGEFNSMRYDVVRLDSITTKTMEDRQYNINSKKETEKLVTFLEDVITKLESK